MYMYICNEILNNYDKLWYIENLKTKSNKCTCMYFDSSHTQMPTTQDSIGLKETHGIQQGLKET